MPRFAAVDFVQQLIVTGALWLGLFTFRAFALRFWGQNHDEITVPRLNQTEVTKEEQDLSLLRYTTTRYEDDGTQLQPSQTESVEFSDDEMDEDDKLLHMTVMKNFVARGGIAAVQMPRRDTDIMARKSQNASETDEAF